MKLGLSALVLIGLTVIPGCGDRSGGYRTTPVTIVNRSSAEITNVTAKGPGFSQPVGTIPPGQARQISVQPSGEASLQLEFEAQGKRHTSRPDGYFEGGGSYQVKATIEADFSVKVDTQIQ
ncbi:hypothetical protein [Alkalinema sp. FACHB-956]|uniref:hypothetical protein n=1 Tax=Alkalinema sp. FACHB-956 TaxID=2692768 RepID=UPI001683F7DE|nr:hypothetical protein [Alkalinema sp. FACHB-956]MBD2326025.1 hypothetical protein [Alkalinema sp. FACHB-956]